MKTPTIIIKIKKINIFHYQILKVHTINTLITIFNKNLFKKNRDDDEEVVPVR